MDDLIRTAIDKLVAPDPVYTVRNNYDDRLKFELVGSITFRGEPTTNVERLALRRAQLDTDKPARVHTDCQRTRSLVAESIATFCLGVAGNSLNPKLLYWTQRYLQGWVLTAPKNDELLNKLAMLFNYGGLVPKTAGYGHSEVTYDAQKLQQLLFALEKIKKDTMASRVDCRDETNPNPRRGRRRRRR